MAPADGHVPRHVAIIMDGNGRWARARGLPRAAGHRQGAEAVKRTVRAAGDLGVRYLTLFGFSSENWKRPEPEVNDLMGLLRHYLRAEIAELHANGVRLRVIGDRNRLARDIRALIENAEATTGANEALNLTVALSYGGRQEIVGAVRRLADDIRAGLIAPDQIDEATLAGRLDTRDLPDPDLLIRTSGEQRISNFMLWQSAYTELHFTPTLWPDFGHAQLDEALRDFGSRERRFGAVAR
ncbi:undecaprenyl pyrophosphate synthetase [Stella humosa]|uniref:Isoprenyl transferase n=1 Tax=Stella humosa TaxID=94 RepID=A0A3N1MDN4_9PROT|nr:isoprenyl transferase [Stella humosa]ROQ01658.1 undecaprenyl pyrophosphate synthetase [Stella humosa]BBK32039.1 isoprenyl transferase [Stella humosa]